jgi:hypothetical protein
MSTLPRDTLRPGRSAISPPDCYRPWHSMHIGTPSSAYPNPWSSSYED